MAKQQSHFSFSVVTALVYVFIGYAFFSLGPEVLFLSSVVLVIAGMLPNIDEGGSETSQELAGLLAAVSPLLLFEFIPSLKYQGISQIVLVVICSYIISRMIVSRCIESITEHRGVMHSIPAAVVALEATYLLFWDLAATPRLFVATAAFTGFMSHLLLDASGNLDLVGRALGKGERKAPVLKLTGKTFGSTFAVYSCMFVLGWLVLKDFYPGLRIFAGVKY